jgi:hypothetical protein
MWRLLPPAPSEATVFRDGLFRFAGLRRGQCPRFGLVAFNHNTPQHTTKATRTTPASTKALRIALLSFLAAPQ